MTNGKDRFQIEQTGLPAEEALRRCRAPFEKEFFLEARSSRPAVEQGSNRRGKESGLIKFTLKTSPGIERNGNEEVIIPQGTARLKKRCPGLPKDGDQIAPPFEFDSVEELFDRPLIAKDRPPLVAPKGGPPDPFLGRKKPSPRDFALTSRTDASFFEVEEPVAEGTEAGVKKSKQRFPVTGKDILK